jgi:uncharacterized membrane protein YeaQ/YmgE (transglycosylase-associated protein family)
MKGSVQTSESRTNAESPGSLTANIGVVIYALQRDNFGELAPARGFQLKANHGGKGMFHIIWYIIIGLLSGVIAKSVMHVHLTMTWTIVLGIIGSLLGGGISHIIFRSRNERYHPAGLIFSTLGAIMILFICYKLKIHLP